MTNEEFHKIGTALEPFQRFLKDTEKGEIWHATRQQLWAHVERQIAALVEKPKDKPADNKPKTPAAKPKPGQPHN